MNQKQTAIALVTGGNRGIGLEVSRQLAQKGMTVIMGTRSIEKGEDALQKLSLNKGKIIPRQLDITDSNSISSLEKWVEQQFGHLDILVNNAGILYDTWQKASTADLEQVQEAFVTNTLGAWRMCQEFLPLIRESQHGRIVNVSSGAGSLASMGSGTPAYSTSKAALNAFTKLLAAELKDTNILVNAVCPGWVATDMGGSGGRPVEEGAAGIVWAATLADDEATGGFFRDGKAIAW